jgi:hypothetical protein
VWHAEGAAIPILEKFAKTLSKSSAGTMIESDGHPRTFPGEVRTAALQAFQKGGSFCPGVKGKRRHKVDLNKERIEFDHVLPYAKGGSSSALNVQVLCVTCNRAKHATAL